MKIKKALSILLSMVMTVSAFSMISFADTDTSHFSLSVSSDKVEQGQTVTVDINFNRDFSAGAVAGAIEFDDQLLECTEIIKAERDLDFTFSDLEEVKQSHDNKTNTQTVGFVRVNTGKDEQHKSGKLLTVKFTAKAVGQASVKLSEDTASENDDETYYSENVETKSIQITEAPVPVSEVVIKKNNEEVKNIELLIGSNETLDATVKPDNATDKAVKWNSSDPKVATVDDNGKVTAIKEGTAKITAEAGDKTATCTVKVVPIEVTEVSVEPTNAEVKIGGTVSLKATVKPDNATDKKVTWSSDKESVATVKDGTVTGVKAGTAKITAKAGDKTATCTVKVLPIEVTEISLTPSNADIKVGGTVSLKATVKPDNATDKAVKWKSSDPKVATVDDNGKVTAIKEGTAKITAEAGDKSATCTVKVSKVEATGIKLNKEKAELTVGAKETLTATVEPENATDKTVTWSSSDETVVTVNNGELTAVKEGSAKITAKSGNIEAVCDVTVVNAPVDKEPLIQVIKDAKEDIAKTKVSENGSDVSKSADWVTQNDVEELNKAIEEAQAVVDDEKATAESVDQAKAALEEAVKTFDAAKKKGTKSSGSSGRRSTAVNKAALKTSIEQAQKNVDSATVSEDGSDVDKDHKWVPASATDTLKEAIKAAQQVADNTKATQTQVDNAKKALDKAVTAFDNAKQDGKKNDSVVNPNPPDKTEPHIFDDVSDTDWFREAVYYTFEKGFFKGTSQTTFSPNVSMTRAMFVTVLGRIENIDQSKYTGTSFKDVRSGQWYSAYVAWGADKGIITGYDSEHFGPNDVITREQMAAIVYRFVKYKGIDISSTSDAKFQSFSDADQVEDYAKEAMIWAADTGIINGTDKGLEPKATATRAQVAQIIMNFDKVFGL